MTTPVDKPKLMLWLCAIWMILQLGRLIAIPLIGDVLAGKESLAWLYPAIVDVIVAVPSPILAWAILTKRGLGVWTVAIVYFVVSIFDHGGATTASFTAGAPQIFGGVGNTMQGWLMGPALQTVIDALMLIWLVSAKARQYFLAK